MCRPGTDRRARAGGRTARLGPLLALAVAAGLGSADRGAAGQVAPAPTGPNAVPNVAPPNPAASLPPAGGPAPAPAAAPEAPGLAPVGRDIDQPSPVPPLAPGVQVVRFHAPAGVNVEILGPAPEPVPVGDNHGVITVGLKVGVPYRLRISNLEHRPGAELFPVVEIVGHLHRPPGIDPGKYPVRIPFTEDDLLDAADRGRLVTQVVYLEDPELALPMSLPKDEIPIVTLSPFEQPLKVAAALGRVMAIVRLGNRRPTPEEVQAGPGGVEALGAGMPCPFTAADGNRCPVACGPVTGTPPPPNRPWLPKDEFLCDGGDGNEPVHFSGDGGLAGIDPRDAVIRFDDGRRARTLPTNTVCVYAPRFAEVRVSVGPNETQKVESAVLSRFTAREVTESAKQGPKRMTQNLGAELSRNRARPSGLAGDLRLGVHGDVRGAAGYEESTHIAGNVKVEAAELARLRQKAGGIRDQTRFLGIKTAESAVITGIIEGAGQTVMTWTPRETVGVETPPNRPGLAVIKRVSAGEAEAGDTLTFAIQYRNMGNTPIRDVTVVDSLLPRLAYVKGSARGPAGTAFTADENKAGSTELRWVLPGPLAPGVEGHVSFEAVVR